MIDTHSHIDLPVFDEDRGAMLARARSAGVHAIVVIGHNPERWRASAELCGAHSNLVRTVGIHPNDAGSWSPSVSRDLTRELEMGDAIAIGETGLDFYRDSVPPDLQRGAFAAQLSLARLFDLPVVIHQRNAEEDVLTMLRAYGPLRGVMHCFSGDTTFATACVGLGFMLGVGGVATYPKSTNVRAALSETPIDALILETDAPYLAPQGRRGKRNEAAYIVESAQTLADVHGLSVEEIADRTTANAVRLFGGRLKAAVAAGLGAGLCA
ncbi:MAG: TatD family hydrolase [Thermomicrobiales bacterium]